MLEKFSNYIDWLNGIVWGLPLIIFIMAVGIFLTIRLKLLQIIHLPRALKYMFKNEEGGTGEVTSFAALCTALSATIGTGNIVGVATAIVAGGPGALFWMWCAAFVGMATKYAEGLLAVKFRKVSENGHVLGGPFYYIEMGMGSRFRWLAKMFAFFGACAGLMGIGTFAQVNGITSAVNNFTSEISNSSVAIFDIEYPIAVIIAGLVITIGTGLVLIGGIKRISNFAQIIVPFMAVIYIIICIILLINKASEIPAAIVEVVEGAFGIRAVAGGALGAMMVAMQKGVARGIFSNESGLGSAPIAAAAAQTNEPVRQGLVSMTGTFIDTIIICTMTGLSIIVTKSWNIGLEGVSVTDQAFRQGLPFDPRIASFLLMLCLIFFAFTTIIGWNYYSERCVEYLTGNQKVVQVYRWLYILAVFIGPYMTVKAVWGIADIFNGLMAFPNLVALFALSGVVARESQNYFKRVKKM